MGTYVQSIILIKTPTEHELQEIIGTVARGKETCETELKITRPYWNTSKHICVSLRNQILFTQKTIQNHWQMLQKLDPDALQPLFGARWPPRPEKVSKKVTWVTFWTSFWEAQTYQNRWKIEQHFRHVFWSTFRASLAPFWERFASIFMIFLDNFSETAILWKIAPRLYENTIFKVSRLRKSIKNRSKNGIENNIDFWIDFWWILKRFWRLLGSTNRSKSLSISGSIFGGLRKWMTISDSG